MADRIDYGSLSEKERMKRIGALFCKAVTLTLTRQNGDLGAPPAVKNIATAMAIGDCHEVSVLEKDSVALLKRFARLGEFSPREAIQFWRISRTSAYRRLRNLERSGWIVKNGKTNAVRYLIVAQTHSILKQV